MSRPRVRIDEAHLRRGLAAGRSLRDLAVEFGVSPTTIADRVAILGLARDAPDVRAEVRAAFEALPAGGRTVQALCSRVGLPRVGVLCALGDLALVPDVPVSDQARRARALREQGLTWSDVGTALGYRGRGAKACARKLALRAGWAPESGRHPSARDTA